MSYQAWFQRRNDHDIRVTGYLQNPATIKQKDVAWSDRTAARLIAECQATIEALTEYRAALAARYAYLEAAPYKLRLELERSPEGWQRPRIWYYVRIRRTYADGTEVIDLEEKYQGSERRAAFARFEELKKQRPGIELLEDTQKRNWER